MKYQNTGFKVLFSLFLVICIAVHIYGLLTRFSDESIPSHIVHILSYSLCLFAFLYPVKYRLIIYLFGAVYPVAYHANCFFTQLIYQGKFNSICFMVIFILPLTAIILLKNEKRSTV